MEVILGSGNSNMHKYKSMKNLFMWQRRLYSTYGYKPRKVHMSQIDKFVNYILYKCVGDLEVNKQFSSKGSVMIRGVFLIVYVDASE